MDKIQAESLVIKLINTAYEAGMHYSPTKRHKEQMKAEAIGDEIIRHLTSRSSRAADACPFCDCVCIDEMGHCEGCGKLTIPPPA